MFALLTMYPGDNIASMYATSMHSGSGYLVTSPDVSAARDGVVDILRRGLRKETLCVIPEGLRKEFRAAGQLLGGIVNWRAVYGEDASCTSRTPGILVLLS